MHFFLLNCRLFYFRKEEEFIWLPFKNKGANKKAACMVKTSTFLKDMHFWRSPTNVKALPVLSGALCAQICSACFDYLLLSFMCSRSRTFLSLVFNTLILKVI